jgi:hypothetical protein
MRRFNFTFLVLLSLAVLSSNHAIASPRTYAQRLFDRLGATSLLPGTPKLAQIEGMVAQGQLLEAAKLATEEDAFYSVVMKTWAARMLSVDDNPYAGLNDAQALILGSTRDGLDARTLLTGDFAYSPDPRFGSPRPRQDINRDFEAFETSGRSLKKYLVKVTPQWLNLPPTLSAAGLLTTRGWGQIYYSGGTNRRAVEGLFRAFLCTPVDGWKEKGLPQFRIRRDVDRVPSGNAANFQNMCSTCHSRMDGLAGAFSHIDFSQDVLRFTDRVLPKYNQNEATYPHGYVTDDDSWVNFVSPPNQARFGWRGNLSGYGLRELGEMISSSRRFSECMTERAFKQVCKRELTDRATLKELADGFEADGYRLKDLFAKTAIQPTCLGGI